MDCSPDDVLRFWLEDCGPEDWYRGGDALDDEIRARFLPAWEVARGGGFTCWRRDARGALALAILVDQFPRNMFRGEALAFATDMLARATAKQAVARGFDLQIDGAARQFFYLPIEHSESLPDQERAVRLIAMRMDAPETLLHAQAHRDIIRRFGRFPFRNDALGRTSSPEERAFLKDGGYGTTVNALRAASQGLSS